MKKNKLTWGEWAFVLFCFLFYLSWSLVQPYTYGPDEEMRFQIPEFIYLYGSLPNGFDERLISPNWGFSYAFYPCWLGPLCSALFMKITSIFSQDFFHLLCAARFTSVISGALTVYFAMKSGKLLFLSLIHIQMCIRDSCYLKGRAGGYSRGLLGCCLSLLFCPAM